MSEWVEGGRSVGQGRSVRTLHLLRHAKSSWIDPELADSDRPLAPRGHRAALRMADHMRRVGIAPDAVLCSPALRARQTLLGVSAAIPSTAEILVDATIYGADDHGLLQRIQELPDTVVTVLLIGHNPALHDLAVRLALDGDEQLISRVQEKVPTCALVTFGCALGTWARLGPGNAVLHDFVVPRDLGT